MQIDVPEILETTRQLAKQAGSEEVPLPTLTAAKEFLPSIIRDQTERHDNALREINTLNTAADAARQLADKARGHLQTVETAHRELVAQHRIDQAKTLSDLKHRNNMAFTERGQILQSLFPHKTWQEAREHFDKAGRLDGVRQLIDRWKELETTVLPTLEREITALENPTF